MNVQRLGLTAAALAVVAAVWLARLCQPERQVRRHTATMLHAIERRNLRTVEALIADKYTDRWKHDKAFVVATLPQAFGDFLFLDIEHQTSSADASTGRTVTQVKIVGQGGPVAQFVIAKVNGLGAPFTFTWEKSGGWPWDWQLSSVDHPTLELGAALEF